MAPRRQRRANKNKRGSSQLNIGLYGRQINVPANPPAIVYRPFSPMTLTVSLTITLEIGSYSMFHADIITYAAKQLGISTNSLRFKIFSVKLWNLTSKNILVYFYEGLTDSGSSSTERSNHPLMYLSDTGSPTTYAAVGFHYPSSTTNNVFGFSDPQTTLYQVAGVKGDVILHRVYIHYANT